MLNYKQGHVDFQVIALKKIKHCLISCFHTGRQRFAVGTGERQVCSGHALLQGNQWPCNAGQPRRGGGV